MIYSLLVYQTLTRTIRVKVKAASPQEALDAWAEKDDDKILQGPGYSPHESYFVDGEVVGSEDVDIESETSET